MHQTKNIILINILILHIIKIHSKNYNKHCNCKNYSSKKINIKQHKQQDIENIKNNEFNKPKKKEKKQIIKKEIDKSLLQNYEVCNDIVFYKWHSNNCTVKYTLIALIITFNKPKILNDWLNSGNEFLKTLAEIFIRYNNKDNSKDDVSIFFHALLKYLVDYYNNNIEIQKKKTEMDSDFIKIIEHFKNMFPCYKVEKIGKIFEDIKNIDELFKNVNKLEFKNYSDFTSSLNITNIIFDIIAKIYNINFEKHYIHEYFQIENNVYTNDFEIEDFYKVPFFTLTLRYKDTNIIHECIIYKKEDKYYLENCNTVIKINKELVKTCYENDDFQPIINIYIKNGGLEYKYKYVDDNLYAEYKNVEKKDKLIYNLCKRDILCIYNDFPEDFKYDTEEDFKYDIEEKSKYYNISQDEIKKIFKELNISKH